MPENKYAPPDWAEDYEGNRPAQFGRGEKESSSNILNVIEWLDIFETPISNPVYQAIYNDDWNVLANAIEGIKNPKEAKDWFDVGFNIPDNFIDKYVYTTLWGRDWKEGLDEEDINSAYDTVRTAVGTTGAIVGDLDFIFGAPFEALGLTDEGLTSLKLQSIAPFLDDADNVSDVKKILKEYNVKPSSEVGQKAIDMVKEGKNFTLENEISRAIEAGQRAGLTGRKGKPLRLPGKAGEIQKAGEIKLACGLDKIKEMLANTGFGQDVKKTLSSADPRLTDNIADTFKAGDRRVRKLLEDMDEVTKTFKNNINELAKQSNFTKEELFNLAEFKNPPAVFHGKSTDKVVNRLDALRQPLEEAKTELSKAKGVDFTPLESEQFHYIPRQTSDEALKAMKETNPDWYDNFYAKDIDKGFESAMYNPSFKMRAFKNKSRDYINQLSRKGKLGVASDVNGNMIEVGNYDQLIREYPELAEQNLVRNLTGGKKVEFYESDPVKTLRNSLRRKARTIGARDTFANVIKKGITTGDVMPLPGSGRVSQGYVKLSPQEAGDLYPLLQDFQFKPEVRDQIKGITKKSPNNELQHIGNAFGAITNNFKKLAIGTSVSYQPKNLAGNLFRSYTDPTTTFSDWMRGQATGFATTLGESPAGKKLNLDRILGNNIPMELPTGEIVTPKMLYDEFLESGGMASGFRQGVIDEGEGIIDKFTRPGFWARENLAERPTRFGDYAAHRLSGFTPEAAQQRQFLNLIDYADWGPGIKKVQTAFPFAKYQLASKPLLWDRLARAPGRFKWPAKIQNYLEQAGNLSEEERKNILQESPPPDWMEAPILAGTDEEGRGRYIDVNPIMGDPLGFALDPVKIAYSDDPKEAAIKETGRALQEALNMTHPIAKGFVEGVSGYDLFRKREIPPATFIGDYPVTGDVPSRITHTTKTLVPPARYIDIYYDSTQTPKEKFIDVFSPSGVYTSYDEGGEIGERKEKIEEIEGMGNVYRYLEDPQKRENLRSKMLNEEGKEGSTNGDKNKYLPEGW